MPYFTSAHLTAALDYLPDHTHASLISFLAMLKSQVPVSSKPSKSFGSPQETELLKLYFDPIGGSPERPWYVPFGSQKAGHTNWKPKEYAGKSLQRMRGDKDYIYLQGKGASNDLWALEPGYLKTLTIRGDDVVGPVPISIHHLAVWMYRVAPFPNHQAAIDRFKTEFQLNNYSLVPSVFSDAIDSKFGAIPLGTAPLNSSQILTLLIPLPSSQMATSQSAGGSAGAATSPIALSAAPSPDDSDYTWDIDPATVKAAIGDLQGMDEAAFRAIAALRAGMHVIFTGPPGTGKTQLARRLCTASEIPFLMAAATDQWSTVDTVGGYFPSPDGDGRLDFLAGFVVNSMISKKALIIDEINRADIDKAFGELFTLLSGNDVDLPYVKQDGSGGSRRRLRLVANLSSPEEEGFENVQLPAWWRLIGSMNDADKASLKRLSYAFIRRFAFVPISIPTSAIYKKLLTDSAGSGADGLAATRPDYLAALENLFADPKGLASIDMAMGFAIPEAMMRQARNEITIDPQRSTMDLLTSTLDLYVSPQFQGRADKHEDFVKLVAILLDGSHAQDFQRRLAVWTGFVE